MASHKNQQNSGIRFGILMCAMVIFGAVEETQAMFLFGSSNNSGPPQSIVTTNTSSNTSNNDSPSIDARPLTVAPEPGSIWLLASGLLGLGIWRLRKKNN